MKKTALAALMVVPLFAHASTPIMADEALACISGGEFGKTGQVHSVSIGNHRDMDLSPGMLNAFVVLKSQGMYSADFKVDGVVTQSLAFRFEDPAEHDVCFQYDNATRAWSASKTSKFLCRDCQRISGGE